MPDELETIQTPNIDGSLERQDALKKDIATFAQTINEPETAQNLKPMFAPSQKKSVFIPKYNLAVETDLQKAEEIEYAADIEFAKRYRDNYFALTDMGAKRSSVVGDAILNFSKGVGSALVSTTQLLERQLTGIADSVVDLPTNLPKWQLDLNEEDVSVKPEVRKRIQDNYAKATKFRKQKLEMMIDKHKRQLLEAGLGQDASDGIMFDIGSGLTSMVGAIGLSIITKSPTSASIFFGWLAGRSDYEELVENGMTPAKAAVIGAVGATAQGMLEYIGTDYLIRSWKLKGLAARALGAIDEPLQEGAQATAEEIIMQGLGNRQKETDETIDDIFYQALLGAIIGAPVSVIGRAGQAALEKKGVEPAKAKEISAAITEKAASQEVMQAVENIIDNEDSPITFPNNDVKKGMRQFIDTARKEIKSITPEQRKTLYDIRNEAVAQAKAQALSDEESKWTGDLMQARALLFFNYGGITPQEWYKTNKLEIINWAKRQAQNKARAAAEQNAKSFNHAAAMYRNDIDDIVAARKYAQANRANIEGQKPTDKPTFVLTLPSQTNIELTGNNALHIDDYHKMTDEQIQEVFNNIENVKEAFDAKQTGRMGGKIVVLKTDVGGKQARVVLEFLQNGRVFLTTMALTQDKEFNHLLKQNSPNAKPINKKTQGLPVVPNAKQQAGVPYGTVPLSINSIKKELGIVNEFYQNDKEFFQTASKSLGITEEETKRQYDEVVRRYKGDANERFQTDLDNISILSVSGSDSAGVGDSISNVEAGAMADGWLKAPNGKDSNLPERQWVMVRTPAFKKWFGDFELLAQLQAQLEALHQQPTQASDDYLNTPAKDWVDGFPNAAVLTTIAAMRKDADYLAGKKGDKRAAYNFAKKVVEKHKSKILEFAKKHPNAILMSVHSNEAEGTNQIPVALADAISNLTGLKYDNDIAMTNKVVRTDSDSWHRIANQAKFSGSVEQGKEYIIIDDVITKGETVNSARYFVEANGGKVVDFLAAGAAQFSAKIALSKETLLKLEKKYGKVELEKFAKELNLYGGNYKAFSESTARTVLSSKGLDAARSEIVARRQERQHTSIQSVAGARGSGTKSQTASQINNQNKINTNQTAEPNSAAFLALEKRIAELEKNVSKVRDENGEPKVVYHGTKRPDRIGSIFKKTRATSGPMPYFSDSAEIGSEYAMIKNDTSIDLEDFPYSKWFLIKKGTRKLDIVKYGQTLSESENRRLLDILKDIAQDDDGNIVLGGDSMFSARYLEKLFERKKHNALAVAQEVFLSDGALYNREEEFFKVLEFLGIKSVERNFPFDEFPAVFNVFLSISNPLDTKNIAADVMKALKEKSKKVKQKTAQGRDFWDKNDKDPKEWYERLEKDVLAVVNSIVWTSIPDWVSDTLSELGYNGIIDEGAKGGGKKHNVFIPFESKQIKSAANRGTFSLENDDIYYQGAYHGGAAAKKMSDGWLKAPNGKDSNLPERLWLMVRTPAFKAWFGDFELAGKWKKVEAIAMKTYTPQKHKDKVEIRKIFNNQIVRNTDIGETVFTNAAADKISFNAGFDSSIIAEYMPELYKNAVLVQTRDVELNKIRPNGKLHKNHLNFKAYHDLFNKFKIGTAEYVIRFSVQELNAAKKGQNLRSKANNQLHSTFISSISVYQKNNGSSANKSANTAGIATASVDNILAEILEKVNDVSKVVDANGEPLVVYHGTEEQFSIFQKDKLGGRETQFFFTPSVEAARDYGTITMPVFLNVKEFGKDGELIDDSNEGISNTAKEAGVEISVKNANQIKSVDNKGMFAANNDDIYYQGAHHGGANINFVKKGSITFSREQAIINLYKEHDKSTLVHELGHLFLKDIEDLARYAKKNPSLVDASFWDMKAKVDAYLGVKEGQTDENGRPVMYTRKQHERFARAFNAYVKTGRAPNSTMRRLFDWFRQWLREIKDTLVDVQQKRLEENPEMIEVFDELLAPMKSEDIIYSPQISQKVRGIVSKIKSGKNIESISGVELETVRQYLDMINRPAPKKSRSGGRLLRIIKEQGVRDTFPFIDKARDLKIKVYKPGEKGYNEALGEDGLQTMLKDLGYLSVPEDVLESIAGDKYQNDALDLIERALDGKPVYAVDDIAELERANDYDKIINDIENAFGNDLAQAEKMIELIDALQEKHFAVISLNELEALQELAAAVEKQNEALGKDKTVADLEKEILRDRQLLKFKSQTLAKKEKEQALREKRLEAKEKNVKAKIDVEKEQKAIKKAKKEIDADKNYIQEYLTRLERKEKALFIERKLYADIKEVVEKISQKNKDLGKKINKKDIEDAITRHDRQKLLEAVNEALNKLENSFEETDEAAQLREKYKNPDIIIKEKKLALLETAKKRIADKTDKTGFRQALRSALSGIEHFSNIKRKSPLDKRTYVMTGREIVLEDFAHIGSWQELVDNLDRIFNQALFWGSIEYQKFMRGAIVKEISRNIWVKRGKQEVGRYGNIIVHGMSANEFFKNLRDIWESDPKELAVELDIARDEIIKDKKEGFNFLERVETQVKRLRAATANELAGRGNKYFASLYNDIMTIRKAARDGKTLQDIIEKEDLKQKTDELAGAAREENKAKGLNAPIKSFLRFAGNWETYINMIFGKKYVKEFSLLNVESQADTQSFIDKKAIDETAAKIYGVSKEKFIEIYRDMLNETYIYNDYKANRNKEPRPVEISKADIITMYIWYKSEEGQLRLLWQFEKPVFDAEGRQITPAPFFIAEMFSKLTQKDREFADYLQTTAQSYYESVNEVYFRLFGLDLKQEEFYFPFKTYTGDPAGELEAQQAKGANVKNPPQTIGRIESPRIRMKPKDPLTILKEHVDSSNRYIFTQETLLKCRKVFKNPEVENAVIMAGAQIKEIGGTTPVNKTLAKIGAVIKNYFASVKNGAAEETQTLDDLKINADVAKALKDKTGVDISDFKHILDKNNVRHIIKEHINTGELNEKDLEKIAEILTYPDSVEYVPKTANNAGKLKFRKRLDDKNYLYVELILKTDKKTLMSKTFKTENRKENPLSALDMQKLIYVRPQSETAPRLPEGNNNIVQNKKNVNNRATFGQDVYDGLINALDRASVATFKAKQLIEEKWLSKFVSNFLKTAVAVKPIIAIKQMAAFINYSEGIPKGEFIKGVSEFIANWKSAKDFMMQDDYIKARFGAGQSNETLKRAMESAAFSKFSKWSDLLTVNVRFGDMASVLMGGYARVKYNMAQGMSKEEAFEEFRLHTMRTQQASVESSLSGAQSSDNWLMRLIFAFRNTPNQYARKIADAYVQFRRGEISNGEFAEVVIIYGVINPLTYAALTYGLTGFFDDDDEDDDIRNILLSPLTVSAGFMPLMDDALLTLSNALITGKLKTFDNGEILGVDDFYDWLNKGVKAINDPDDVDFTRWLKLVDFPSRAAAGVPLETIVSMFAGVVDVFSDEKFKGGLKIFGYTDYRAGLIADGKRGKNKN